MANEGTLLVDGGALPVLPQGTGCGDSDTRALIVLLGAV
jgi:hypothetical protein